MRIISWSGSAGIGWCIGTVAAMLALVACQSGSASEDALNYADALDVHSYGNPEQVRVTDIALDLAVSFEQKRLAGAAELGLDIANPDAPLILDTRDLDIQEVETSRDGEAYTAAEWKVGEADPILGAPLTVSLPSGTRRVRITYSSRPEASGLQWLAPEQTAGKTAPFLFSQNQSIHARSWIPIQDSPGVRVSYSATIHAPAELEALMSAERTNAADGIFQFSMDTPIPPYLIALAVGDLEFREIGPRTGVWAEPPLADVAALEFEDMEQMIYAVEGLYGPYRWGRYDLLILPPSFPFGGMENPRLTFATPTILAGDKSLVGLVSHELAHSWSGNLVTNATWRDFWLNEGFTTYIENRIQEDVYGPELATMERALALRDLEQEMKEMPVEDQVLHINLSGRDPDTAVTGVPYTKGALLLHRMEEVFGRKTFDAYLRQYFDEFAFRSITTATMLEYLKRELFASHPQEAKQIALEEWVYLPGLPATAPLAVSERLEEVAEDAAAFAAGNKSAGEIDAGRWSTQEWLEFLGSFGVGDVPDLTSAQMSELDQVFGFTDTGNSEVLDLWLQMAVRAGYEPAYPRMEAFLIEVGRQKFLKPIYTELVKTPEGRERALAIYERARPGYHPIARTSIDRIVMDKNP